MQQVTRLLLHRILDHGALAGIDLPPEQRIGSDGNPIIRKSPGKLGFFIPAYAAERQLVSKVRVCSCTASLIMALLATSISFHPSRSRQAPGG